MKRAASVGAANLASDAKKSKVVTEVPSTISTIEIYADGDLKLIVGPSRATKEFLVASTVLRVASRPFSAMFSPRFAEGQALLANSVAEVRLEDDDADGIELLLLILHSRVVPKNCEYSLDQIHALSIVAQKYDVVAAVYYVAKDWMRHMSCPKTKDIPKMLAAMARLRQADHFRRWTAWCAYHGVPNRSKEPLCQGLPPLTLWFIRLQQIQAEAIITKAVTDPSSANRSTASCVLDGKWIHAWKDALFADHLPGLNVGSFKRLAIEWEEDASDLDSTETGNDESTFETSTDPRLIWTREIYTKASAICSGLCLYCLLHQPHQCDVCKEHDGIYALAHGPCH